ncbi:uncharacterized protein LOC117110785 [Anneissia japonica]|uniref:uncharacterized protein LOC117110785 n=1 Tax=Anneissia japonica TaxID=1529436 RepID=UPI0014259B14|nr:uncharacterized protein LOC117110785 [Anneissia japonica]
MSGRVKSSDPPVQFQSPAGSPRLRRARSLKSSSNQDEKTNSAGVSQMKHFFENSPMIMHLKRPPLTPRTIGKENRMKNPLPMPLSAVKRQLGEDSDNEEVSVSPSLAQLRMTPGKALQKQKLLEEKHRLAKSKVSSMGPGGGVSIWPEMDDMRLTPKEMHLIVIISLVLIGFVCQLFWLLHGNTFNFIKKYNYKLYAFSLNHPLDLSAQENLNTSCLAWHDGFFRLMNSIDEDLGTDLSKTPASYKLAIFLYLGGLGTLLYYLADSMLAKSKLTPKRIKSWISLLVVVGTWTILMVSMLAEAQKLEVLVQGNVHEFNSKLGELVYLNFDLSQYHNILLYWKTRCLPPTTKGVLSILGMLQVQDVSYYLQYYSLPVLTALLTPIVKLVLALKEIYSVKVH